MKKINCWEFNKCGREVGGSNASILGVCPVSTAVIADGFCGGINGGRSCACMSSFFHFDCNKPQCEGCRFYEILHDECGDEFSLSNLEKHIAKDKDKFPLQKHIEKE